MTTIVTRPYPFDIVTLSPKAPFVDWDVALAIADVNGLTALSMGTTSVFCRGVARLNLPKMR